MPDGQDGWRPSSIISASRSVAGRRRALPAGPWCREPGHDAADRAPPRPEASRDPERDRNRQWAFRRGQRYGTMICDPERRQAVALLRDRECGTVEAWLSANPKIGVLFLDRGGGYGEVAARALLKAIQVADRWHLMECQRRLPRRRAQVGDRHPRRGGCRHDRPRSADLRRTPAVRGLPSAGGDCQGDPDAVATGHADTADRPHDRPQPQTRAQRAAWPNRRRVPARQSSLEAYLPRLDAEWAAGCRNGAELWLRLRAGGFTGSLRVVGEWTTRRRRHEQATEGTSGKVPSARLLAQLMTTGQDGLSKAETMTVTTVEAAVPALDEARSLPSSF